MARKRSGRLLAVGVLAAFVLASLTTASAAAPSQAGGAGADFQRESQGALDADYRTGAVAPRPSSSRRWPR